MVNTLWIILKYIYRAKPKSVNTKKISPQKSLIVLPKKYTTITIRKLCEKKSKNLQIPEKIIFFLIPAIFFFNIIKHPHFYTNLNSHARRQQVLFLK